MGGDIHGVVLGKGAQSVADELASYVDTVHLGDHDGLTHRLAQPYAKVLADVAKKLSATHVWAAATVAATGDVLLPVHEYHLWRKDHR